MSQPRVNPSTWTGGHSPLTARIAWRTDDGNAGIKLRGSARLGLDGVRPVRGLRPDHLAFRCTDPPVRSFLTLDNWRTIAVQTVIVGIAALGMTIIMIAGGIDLSVGSTVALVTVCIAMFVKKVDPALAGFAARNEARLAAGPLAGHRDRRTYAGRSTGP